MAAAKTRKLIINHKEYEMPKKVGVLEYMDYLEVRDSIMENEKKNGLYTRKQFENMLNCICALYGNQFTVDELIDKEGGLSVGEIVTEFVLIEAAIGEEVDRKAEKIQENFTNGK